MVGRHVSEWHRNNVRIHDCYVVQRGRQHCKNKYSGFTASAATTRQIRQIVLLLHLK